MRTETMYRILVATVIVLLFVIGIYIGVDSSTKDQENKITTSVSNQNVSVKPYLEEYKDATTEDLLIDVSVVYTDVYPDCGHTIEQEEKYENTTVNKIKKDIEMKDFG